MVGTKTVCFHYLSKRFHDTRYSSSSKNGSICWQIFSWNSCNMCV